MIIINWKEYQYAYLKDIISKVELIQFLKEVRNEKPFPLDPYKILIPYK